MERKKERIKTMSDINSIDANPSTEPVAPTVAFVRHTGDQSGRTADYDAYIQDIEDRTKRTAEFQAKRQLQPQEPKVELSVIDAAIDALEAAAVDFEGPTGYGKPNQPLIDAKLEVERLRGELAAAEDVLAKIEARGDSVARLTAAVASAETQLQSLVGKAEAAEILSKAHAHYGWDIPWDRVSSEMKRDFRNHASVMVFKKFSVQRSIVNPGQTPSVEALQRQLHLVGSRLAALREHIDKA
jgi:hypothetical protein